MAKPKQVFPDVLYIVREEEDDEYWFVAHKNLNDIEHGTTVAVYDVTSQHVVNVTRELK